jgi:hypothetical protein
MFWIAFFLILSVLCAAAKIIIQNMDKCPDELPEPEMKVFCDGVELKLVGEFKKIDTVA